MNEPQTIYGGDYPEYWKRQAELGWERAAEMDAAYAEILAERDGLAEFLVGASPSLKLKPILAKSIAIAKARKDVCEAAWDFFYGETFGRDMVKDALDKLREVEGK